MGNEPTRFLPFFLQGKQSSCLHCLLYLFTLLLFTLEVYPSHQISCEWVCMLFWVGAAAACVTGKPESRFSLDFLVNEREEVEVWWWYDFNVLWILLYFRQNIYMLVAIYSIAVVCDKVLRTMKVLFVEGNCFYLQKQVVLSLFILLKSYPLLLLGTV